MNHCTSPKIKVTGKGSRRILIFGEWPSSTDDVNNKHFSGDSGSKLQEICYRLGVDLRRDCWLTNAAICHPMTEPDQKKAANMVDHCRPNLLKTIEELQPNVIIPMGYYAVKSIVEHIWKESSSGGDSGIDKYVGWKIPSQKINKWVCPTYHPEHIFKNRNPGVVELLMEKHLEAAFSLCDCVPWSKIPDYESKITVEMDSEKVIRFLDSINSGVVAFDYETNMLKPDSDKARIASCAVCWNGNKTVAFPWNSRVAKSMWRLLHCPEVAKVGYNLKFENRWTIAMSGKPVENWIWDGMIASHVIDNRSGVTSLKFQAFVLLGVYGYDDHIKKYLLADGGNDENKIHMIDMPTLLKYNGLDALLEYKVWKKQSTMIG